MQGKSRQPSAAPFTEYEQGLRERLERHVRVLAIDIGGRSVDRRSALDAAADYIRRELRSFGYTTTDQPYNADSAEVRNIEAEIGGIARPTDIAIIGAHYDTAGALPGANDNATGVAATLEIARALTGSRPEQAIRFVFFVNEEMPFFQTDLMGSMVYAKRCAERRERVNAMLALETIGYYSDAAGSQEYPPELEGGLPSTGNFIGFVSDMASRALLDRTMRAFRHSTDFPLQGAPAAVSLSDHSSFWRYGYPAIMVTDTAMYRYPYYHTAEDTPDKIDFDRFARVVRGLTYVAADLAGTSFTER